MGAMKLSTEKNSGDEVATRLVQTAISLFGEKGTSTSLREVQRKAGVLNEAAIRYYFGNREAFLEACIRDISKRFELITSIVWKEFNEKKALHPVTTADVSTVLVKSFYLFLLEDKASVWLMARMIREESDFGQDLLIRYFGDFIWALEDEIRELMPQKAHQMVRMHLFLAINNTLNGMVDQDLLWRLPDLEGKKSNFRLDYEEFAKGFISYISAGIQAG
jgi:AcrR family transcriptional regulator